VDFTRENSGIDCFFPPYPNVPCRLIPFDISARFV
jgi:hypothetical protein